MKKTMKKMTILSILLCLCMVVALVAVPVPRASAEEINPRVLDGVYSVTDDNDVELYIMTFDNGKLTIKAVDEDPYYLAGEYSYTENSARVPQVEGEDFSFSTLIDFSDPLRIYAMYIKGVEDSLSLKKTAELPGANPPAGGASKLDGVYTANLFGMTACTMTFDNGKLTVEDHGMSGIPSGEYVYTVTDGVPVVTKADGSDCGFQISKDESGNLSLKTPNVALPMPLTKTAELPPKLDGVYIANFFGMTACTMTFNNGKLTVEDHGMSGIPNGEYAYTFKDGALVVTKTDGSDCGFQISLDDSGNMTLKTPNVALPMPLEKTADLPGGSTTEPTVPSEPETPTTAPQAPTTVPQAPTTVPQAPTTAPQAPTTAPQAPTTQPSTPSTPVDPNGDGTFMVIALAVLSMTALVVLVSKKRAF